MFVALPSNPGISRVELETNRGEGFVTAKKICQSFPYSSIYLPTKHQQITVENKDIVADTAAVIGTKCGILDICGEYYKPSNDKFGLQAQAIVNTNFFGLKNVIEAMRLLWPGLLKTDFYEKIYKIKTLCHFYSLSFIKL